MSTLVVVPTYDERDTIGTLLHRLAEVVPAADVLVVDDSSPDGTAGVVRDDVRFARQVFLLERRVRDGLGGAYRAGFAWALEHGYDHVVQMDADGSHPVERVPALLEALLEADVAVGSRYVPRGGVRDWAWHRRLLSWAGNLYVRIVLGLHTHDTTAGFKAFRAAALRAVGVLGSTSNGYCFQVENTWRAERRGLRVREVPITFTDRTAGSSKMSGAVVAEALARVLVWRWREVTAPGARHREVATFLAVGGAGYVVDVAVFNLLWGLAPFDTWGPTAVKAIAVAAAMVVTYLGNALVTWRGQARATLGQVATFVVLNAIGLGFSVACLWVSHDVLGLTSRVADNVSANVVGLALGTAFRYWTYRWLVFRGPGSREAGSRDALGPARTSRVPAR